MTDPFGAQLAALRGVFGVSQRELARRSGVSERAIAAIERGRPPMLTTARLLVQVLGHSIELRPSTRGLRPCGTAAAANRHRYHGEPLCSACKRWDRERKASKRACVSKHGTSGTTSYGRATLGLLQAGDGGTAA